MKRCLTALLACACSAAWAEDDAAAMRARIEAAQEGGSGKFDRYTLAELMQQLNVPGVSVAVVRDFKLHWAKGYGVADRDSGRAVDTATRFQAASLSKPVTAMGALYLAQMKKLDLDADVNTVLASWKVPARPWPAVTPRSLLSHTSGAADGFGFPGYLPGVPLPSAKQILEGQAPSNVGKVTFARAPYAQYQYSGGGYVLMQLAMTAAAQQAFAPFMQSAVLGPLQMAHSAYAAPADAQQAALAHDRSGKRMAAPWHVYPELAPAGLWTTPSDMARFIIEIQTAIRGPGGKVLSPRSAREMVAPAGVGPVGLGLFVGMRGKGWYFTHGGDNAGYKAWMIGHLRKGYGYVILTNGDNGSALIDPLADRIGKAYSWDAFD